jgi:hypothetical protein
MIRVRGIGKQVRPTFSWLSAIVMGFDMSDDPSADFISVDMKRIEKLADIVEGFEFLQRSPMPSNDV